jgi:abequosyltransferase
MVERFGDWGILNSACIGFRSGNDQFLTKFGWLKRMQMDAIAYEQIAQALFALKPRAKFLMRQQIFKAHILARIRNAKIQIGPTPELWDAAKFLYHHFRDLPAFWYSALPTLSMPKWLLRKVRTAFQRYSSRSGARRAKNAIRSLSSSKSGSQRSSRGQCVD